MDALPMVVATTLGIVVCMLLCAGAHIADKSKDNAPKP